MDQGSAFLLKIWFMALLTAFLLMIAVVLFQISEKNDYQLYVNNEIERHGGLTTEALSSIKHYSDTHFNGRFTMKSSSEKKAYGEIVPYVFELKIKPIFFELDLLTREFTGSAASKVR